MTLFVKPSSRQNAKARGFTLVEFLMVIVILATVTAIGAPRYANALANYRAEAAARRVVADINLARSRAVMKSTSQTITFSVSSNQSQIVGMADLDKPTSTYTTSFSGEPYRATLKSAAFGNSTSLVFNGYGLPASGGTVVISAGSATKTITVNATTGGATFP